jgi:hypothetical protein
VRLDLHPEDLAAAANGASVLADFRALHDEHDLMELFLTNPVRALSRLSLIPPDSSRPRSCSCTSSTTGPPDHSTQQAVTRKS